MEKETKLWNDFLLSDFFSFEKGNQNNMAVLNEGLLPLVSARKCDNGYKGFVETSKRVFPSHILTINNDGDGGAGIAYYQPYNMALDSHVTALIPKIELSRLQLLFVSMCITKQRNRFGHGYSINNNRLKAFRIMLPIDSATNEPDWKYMEQFMSIIEQHQLREAINILCKRLIINDIISGGGNLYPRWKEFYFTEVFTRIQRGKRLTKANQHEGSVPYVSSTAFNNGVDGFIGNDNYVRSFRNCLTVANSGSVGSSFFHHYKFVASDHVTSLERDGVDKYAYLFMVPMINRLSEKYSFNREINDERIRREKILLPVTENGDIDFQFMSNLMRQIEKDILNVTLSHIKEKLNVNKCKWGGVKWKNFVMNEVFTILVPGKSKGLNHLTQVDRGGVNYLGATNLNNGVLGYVLPIHQQVQKGNCIAFIRNGEGSMGYAVYKEEDFIATSDITLGYNPHLNRYTGMFITTIADRVRGKYNFGYKRNSHRLSKEVLTLPINANDEIDWSFMELFMRSIESEQIMSYLQIKEFNTLKL